jgi:hypothetical protein
LALQFVDTRLVLFVLVLEVDLLQVLDGGVEIVQAKNFGISDFDLGVEFLRELLLCHKSLLHLLDDLV